MSKNNKSLRITIREYQSDDTAFIFSSWLRSFKTSFFAKDIANKVYFWHQHKLIENIVSEGGKILVACDPEDTSVVYGWIVYSHLSRHGLPCLHYIYVKQSFRGLGMAKALVKAAKIDTSKMSVCSHITGLGKTLAEKYNFLYNPYIIYPLYDSKAAEARAAEYYQRDDVVKIS